MNKSTLPLISVVIPTYNCANFLKKALQSVIDQSYKNWEAIVIDNYSIDNTQQVIKKFSDSRIKYFKNKNLGNIANSRNKGIKNSNGNWIAFLDSDDWWLPDKLKICLEYSNKDFDLIYHDLKILSKDRRLFSRNKIKTRKLKEPILIDLLVNGNAIGTSSVLVKKQLIKEIGFMDERKSIIAAEDYNTWLKIATLTNHFLYVPKELGYYRIHDEGISRKNMSLPTYHAAYKFLYKLDVKQRIKFDSRLKYTSGRFDYLTGEYSKARKNLLFCLRYGRISIKIKSAIMLILSFFNISI